MENINSFKYESKNLIFFKSSMTYMTKEDWNKYILPNLNDDKSFNYELNQIIKIQNVFVDLLDLIFPKEAHNRLRQNILYSSMIYYYKYILFNQISHSAISLEEKILLCLSCIFIAFKAENKAISIEYLKDKGLPYLNDQIKKDYQKEKFIEMIFDREFKILISFECNANIDNPYIFLRHIKTYLEKIKIQKDIISEVIKGINNYLNDTLLFPLYLYFTSYEIFLSCTLLVIKTKKYNFFNFNDIIKLTNIEINKDNINQCATYISKISNALEEKRTDSKPQKQITFINNDLNFTNLLSINVNQ